MSKRSYGGNRGNMAGAAMMPGLSDCIEVGKLYGEVSFGVDEYLDGNSCCE